MRGETFSLIESSFIFFEYKQEVFRASVSNNIKRFLEYCYMIDVKVALEGMRGEKTRGLKAAVKYVKEHDMGMSEVQLQGAMNM